MPPDVTIIEFWSWFSGVASKLSNDFEDAELLAQLDTQIGKLGGVAWELGPGLEKENFLAVSPDGDPELLSLARHIVSKAPSLPEWEFHAARPPRPEGLQFTMEGTDGRQLAIDARKWRYVLFRFPDGMFDLLLEQRNLQGASEADRYTAAVVLVDSILGEGTRLARINEIEPTTILAEKYATKATPIDRLRMQFQSLLNA